MSSPITSPDLARVSHVHLDPLGGIAGDMFLAAALDLWPQLFDEVEAAMRAAGLPDDWQVRLEAGHNGAIAGRRLDITAGGATRPTGRYRDLRARLQQAGLKPRTQAIAADILHRLAEAEAAVHGVEIDNVHFHELADWDSIADVVGAATVIAALPHACWSTAALPLGRGQIKTAHGLLPIPAPATALLLRGLPVHDDGIPGERVTPTGAAIVAALQPATRVEGSLALAGAGHGLGTRTLDGMPNVLRMLSFIEAQTDAPDRIGVIRFEVDDQTPEDLAIALANIAAARGAVDVCQWPVYGKKGRIAIAVQVLCKASALPDIAACCLNETSTIGLRTRIEDRVVLPRSAGRRTVDGNTVRAKTVTRPDGTRTSKAEADDLAVLAGGKAGRERVRRLAEADDGGD